MNAAVHAHAPSRAIEVSGVADKYNAAMTKTVQASLVRLAQWLPWMEMNGRAGMLYFNAMGRKLQGYDQLPELMKTEIAERYPEYTAPPPLDDARRNETSWTYMKKIIDSRTEKPAESGHH